MSSQSNTPKPVISFSEWKTNAIKYMPPKVNEKGGKAINVISTQSSRSLHITTPPLTTFGISDWIDEKGESDGKYSISLVFPNIEYSNKASEEFLQKLKDFENQVLDDAVRNSESWWGEEMSREVVKHTFFPFLKYTKNKDTKKIDLSKPPTIRAKVPCYNGKWAVEIYNTKSEIIFPCSNDMLSPVDFVQKLSNVACVLQCSGIWIGGKGWGLTWKMIQCVVKPREVVSVYGKCHVELSMEDMDKLDEPSVVSASKVTDESDIVESVVSNPTEVEDSDGEDNTSPTEKEVLREPVPDPEDSDGEDDVVPTPKEPEPVSEPVPPPTPVVSKKVVKKAPLVKKEATEEVVNTPVVSTPAPVKKTIKKAVVSSSK
jgi:hypothetical protein